MSEALRRPADLAARYGGEEYAALLPETILENAQIVAEAIRKTVAGLLIPNENSPVASHVTISIGVACASPQGDGDPSAPIKAADAALYRAKRNGHDRTETQQ